MHHCMLIFVSACVRQVPTPLTVRLVEGVKGGGGEGGQKISIWSWSKINADRKPGNPRGPNHNRQLADLLSLLT